MLKSFSIGSSDVPPDDNIKPRPPSGGGSSSGGGHIGFEGYSVGFNGPGIPPMTGGNMGYATYPPATCVSH